MVVIIHAELNDQYVETMQLDILGQSFHGLAGGNSIDGGVHDNEITAILVTLKYPCRNPRHPPLFDRYNLANADHVPKKDDRKHDPSYLQCR